MAGSFEITISVGSNYRKYRTNQMVKQELKQQFAKVTEDFSKMTEKHVAENTGRSTKFFFCFCTICYLYKNIIIIIQWSINLKQSNKL